MTGEFSILSINVSERTGVKKTAVQHGLLREGHGLEGDAHAGDWHRQISLLAEEDIEGMRGRGIEIGFGDFAENITTRGVDLAALPIGAHLYIGPAILQVTQIGKECHAGCAISRAVGDCVMPRRGVSPACCAAGRSTVRVAVVTISDRASRGQYADLSGPAVEKEVRALFPSAEIARSVVPDEPGDILSALEKHAGCDFIFTTGGTGISPRDVTPEVTMRYCRQGDPRYRRDPSGRVGCGDPRRHAFPRVCRAARHHRHRQLPRLRGGGHLLHEGARPCHGARGADAERRRALGGGVSRRPIAFI